MVLISSEKMGLYSYLFLHVYTPVDSGWFSEVSNNVPAIVNASSFNLIIVFMHTKKPNRPGELYYRYIQ